jgi:hypothetical protein
MMQTTTTPDPAAAQAMAMAMLPFIGFSFLIGFAIVIVPFWQIFKKAGMSGAMSLLMAIPLVNLVMLYVLAFSDWKVVPRPDMGAGYLPPAYPPGYVPPPPTGHAPGYIPPTSNYGSQPYSPAAPSTQAPYPPPPPPGTNS